jgi:recombination protein RecT
MRRSEINKVRQASQTGAVGRVVAGGPNKGKPIEPKGPWVDWFGEMARKTVLRRHSKVLPMSGDLIDTFERDDAEEARARGAVAGAAGGKACRRADRRTTGRGQIEDRSGTEAGVTLDMETGEIITDPRTGMTEVDEETARELDAREGRADGEHGDQFDGSAQHDANADFLDRLAKAKTKNAVTNLDEEFQRISGSLSDGDYEKLNNALADAAKRVNRRD